MFGGGEDEQVRAMQRDSSTYCDEPKEVDEYEAWICSFRIDDRKDEIEELLSSNAFMQELQNRIGKSATKTLNHQKHTCEIGLFKCGCDSCYMGLSLKDVSSVCIFCCCTLSKKVQAIASL
jgi:hypothetical protein